MKQENQFTERYYTQYRDLNSPFTQILKTLLLEFIEQIDLIKNLIKRGLISEYRRSFIGALWILLSPLIQIISWTVLKKASILNAGETDVPYPVYILTGTLIWGLFFNTFNASISTLSKYRTLLLRSQIPVELFFIVDTTLTTTPFLISFYLSSLIFIFFNIAISPIIFALPILIIPIILFANALGMFLSIFTIISYDFRRIVKALFSFALFFTPIVYSYNSLEPTLFKTIVWLNPLTYLVTTPRDLILKTSPISINSYLFYSIVSLLVFYISFRIFNFSKQRLLERIF